MRLKLLVLGAALAGSLNAAAVEMDGGFTNTEPTVTGWDEGWNPDQPKEQTNYTGWDYVGTVDGASGVYLGDDWVLSVEHVAGSNAGTPGAADFTLDSGSTTLTYTNTGNYFTFTDPVSGQPADLVLFQIADPTKALASLPSLSLATSAPADYLNNGTGSTVVSIGYGNQIRNPTSSTPTRPSAKAWGVDTVTLSTQSTPLPYPNPEWTSTDFYTSDQTFDKPGASPQMNDSELVPGDSGGGDFILNGSTGLWQLAGLNEGYGDTVVYFDTTTHRWESTDDPGSLPGGTREYELDFSAYVQISEYAQQITTDMAPEPPAWVLAAGGLALLGAVHRYRRRLSL